MRCRRPITLMATGPIKFSRIRLIISKRTSPWKKMAELSNLSVTSFCRFFKNLTQKSYYDFLTEIRINHACRLLINTNMKAGAIAEESGFENTSNFYRHFKRFKASTPSSFKKIIYWPIDPYKKNALPFYQ